MNALLKVSALTLALALLVVLPGCSTDAFCFANCGGGAGGKGGSTNTFDGSTSSGGSIFGNTGGTCTGPGCTSGTDGSAGGSQSTCVPTNGGVEICDGKDNDCDGLVDEPGVPPQGIDFSNVHTCGNCATDCTGAQGPLNVIAPGCTPPATLDGKTAGTCTYTGCAPNTYNVDGNEANGCEYYCPWNPNGTNKTDLGGPYGCGKDDDCNGKIDDGLNFCSDPQNCGTCGFVCSLANVASATCVSSATGANCNANNTHCVVGQCADGFFDVNGSPDDGCEYPCTKTNGGVEICDGLDNDCNGLIDNEDPALEALKNPDDTLVFGSACSGGTLGLCLANQGVTKCIDSAAKCCDKDSNNVTGTSPRYPTTGIRNDVCVGVAPPHVVTPGQVLETCNGVDDDCDGVVDDNTVDSGGVCGNSVGTCTTGNYQCVGAVLVCQGSTGADPTGEICDGKDNDCDGVIDGTAPATKIPCSSSADCTTPPNVICLPLSNDPNDKGCVAPPHDITDLTTGLPLVCGVTPSPPSGVTQPCRPGTKACLGGGGTLPRLGRTSTGD
jgi:Notch-like protein